MTIGLRNGALALGLIGGAAFLPLPAYALEGDVEVETPGVAVEVGPDGLGILPGGPLTGAPDVVIETPGADVYVDDDDDGDDDAPPAATVEADPD